jgi:DNA-binding FadR family transcriptional regulator
MEFYSALRQRGKAFRELMALRPMIECACVVELARPGRQAARESLREALQTMVHCRKDLDAFGRADIAFHILLVDAAENDLFSTIMGGLMPGLGVQYALETYVEAGIVDKILREHESICEALDAGRGPRARTALRHHLMASAAHFERLLGDVQL